MEMARDLTAEERALIRRQIAAVRQAAPALEAIRNRELQAVDTQEAIRILFGSYMPPRDSAREATSGFVEMYARLARSRR